LYLFFDGSSPRFCFKLLLGKLFYTSSAFQLYLGPGFGLEPSFLLLLLLLLLFLYIKY
jgi:hypothetical protein